MEKFLVSEKESGTTLEKYVRKVIKDAPLSFIYKLFRKKDIKVNGHWQDKKFVLSSGDEVSIYITADQLEDFKNKRVLEASDSVKKWIVFEDENILIINKPRGVLVQPDASNEKSLDKMVAEYTAFKGETSLSFVPGPVHRLDRNTSGLIVFGKNKYTLQYLSTLFKNHEVIGKHYLALVCGDLKNDGIVEKSLLKTSNNKVLVSDSEDAKDAKTIYHVLERFGNYTLLDIILLTGRTHQIRSHMSYINHPVVGDEKYGNFEVNRFFQKKYKFSNQFLHAHELNFGDVEEPLKYLKNQNFVADLPEDMANILKDLKEDN